jgi:hypothetical protein
MAYVSAMTMHVTLGVSNLVKHFIFLKMVSLLETLKIIRQYMNLT